MLKGSFKEVLLQILNIGFGLGAILLMGRGFFIFDGLAGLGLALLMTSLISFFAFRYGIEQELHEKRLRSSSAVSAAIPTQRMDIAS